MGSALELQRSQEEWQEQTRAGQNDGTPPRLHLTSYCVEHEKEEEGTEAVYPCERKMVQARQGIRNGLETLKVDRSPGHKCRLRHLVRTLASQASTAKHHGSRWPQTSC